MKIKTVAYKGSKRRLLEEIEKLAAEVSAKTVFDGFSGTGIVSAYLRTKGYKVSANDLNHSSYVYGKVFLEGFNETIVKREVDKLNALSGCDGWITDNYSGTKERVIRGTGGKREERPLGYTRANAMKIDHAREYIERLSIGERERNALIFSIILAADKVFNNSNDQKSCLKEWTSAAKKDIVFQVPTLIEGPVGRQEMGNVFEIDSIVADFVYFDPPYTHGVLYTTCYHLNDSLASWQKEELEHSYAIPRPLRLALRKNDATSDGFYSKKTVKESFKRIFSKCDAKRIVVSYSDAPRNSISYEELIDLCKNYGEVKVQTREHPLCTQPNALRKISTSLNEIFIIIDKVQKK